MPTPNTDLLRDAVARNSGLVLSLPSAGILRHHKSRFLAEDPGGFWVESVPTEGPLIGELIGNQTPAGVSFRMGQEKVVFATPLLRREPQYRVNADTTLEALLLATPTTVKTIQRRNNYRVRIVPEFEIAARVWRIAPRAYIGDRPMAAQEITTTLLDLSVGGLGVLFKGKDGEAPKVTPEDRLRVELVYKGEPILIEGRIRSSANVGGPDRVRTGISFKPLDVDLEGRQKLAVLTRIVGELQREEVRRARLGVA